MDWPAVGHGEFDDDRHEQQAERGKAGGEAQRLAAMLIIPAAFRDFGLVVSNDCMHSALYQDCRYQRAR
jgi:hypothetical protein